MYAAKVTEWGKTPEYVEVDDPATPPGPDYVEIKVVAAGLHSLVRARAAGKHFSSGALPHIPGTDGVGRTLDEQTVYFSSFGAGGSYCDVVRIPRQAVCSLPKGVDETQVAAFTNPGISSWLALKTRITNLPPDFTVLIMEVTSASGAFAVSIPRALSAGKVIGCARNSERMSRLDLDGIIQLRDPVSSSDFSTLDDVDIVLDYLYGPPAEHLLKSSLATLRPVQYVHIGALAGLEINLPGERCGPKTSLSEGLGQEVSAWLRCRRNCLSCWRYSRRSNHIL